MTLVEAVLLGIVQGLTEFLPISSTAHLRIVPALLGWEDPGAPFTAVTQIGTLVAVLVYFRSEIATLSRAAAHGLIRGTPFETPDARMAWWIGLGTLPIIVAGLLLKDSIESDFRSLHVIAGSLIALAALLALAERRAARLVRDMTSMSAVDVMLIGIAQAVALIPGSSRSGTTMTMGLFLGLRRDVAASFSFLLSVPAVAASGVYQLYTLRQEISGEFGVALLVATAVAGVVGYASIDFLIRFLKRRSTMVFIVYRIALGVLLLALLHAGVLQP